jgi:flagellar hook-basal body complex protein FliE
MQIEALQMTPVRMTGESHLGETQSKEEAKSFSEYLTGALQEANDLQNESERLNKALAAGRIDDVSQVVVAGEKAEIAIQLVLQVRNRAVEAYQELARMQV